MTEIPGNKPDNRIVSRWAVWDDNHTQFTRLLAEIAAVADLSAEQIQAIADSTSLEPHEVHELFIRAEREFELIKRYERQMDLQSLDELNQTLSRSFGDQCVVETPNASANKKPIEVLPGAVGSEILIVKMRLSDELTFEWGWADYNACFKPEKNRESGILQRIVKLSEVSEFPDRLKPILEYAEENDFVYIVFKNVEENHSPHEAVPHVENGVEQTIEITMALQATGCIDQQLLDHLGTQAETWFRTLQHEGMVTPSDPASAERYEQTALDLASVDSRALSEPTKALTE